MPFLYSPHHGCCSYPLQLRRNFVLCVRVWFLTLCHFFRLLTITNSSKVPLLFFYIGETISNARISTFGGKNKTDPFHRYIWIRIHMYVFPWFMIIEHYLLVIYNQMCKVDGKLNKRPGSKRYFFASRYSFLSFILLLPLSWISIVAKHSPDWHANRRRLPHKIPT